MSIEATKNFAEKIRLAMEQKPAHINGICKVSPEDARIFYNLHQNTASWLYSPSASPEQLQDLASACQPATFGRNHEDILDETYRKALKMDANAFSTSFNPWTYGILKRVQKDLLDPNHRNRDLRAELYKLNMYGEGSFFKAHKDTPRGEDMIGSLVVVLPTPHTGGDLLLRHGGKEWSFDSGHMLQNAESPSVAYVAFFSDVEHEVVPVTSGSRITLTWNLYLSGDTTSTPSSHASIFESTLASTLANLQLDPDFIPMGGYLGFGLDYQYPINADPRSRTDLEELVGCLKGSDAALLRSLEEAGLKAQIHAAYRVNLDDMKYYDIHYDMDRDFIEDYDDSRQFLIAPHTFNLAERYGEIEKNVVHTFIEQGGKLAYPYGSNWRAYWGHPGDNEYESVLIVWVTPPKAISRFTTAYIHYGNESTLDFAYADLVLVAEIPPVAERIA